MIPIWAITNGLITPIMLVVPYLLSLSEWETLISQLAAYGVLSILLILFLVKGRAWRASFDESMKHRSLRGSETMMLCMATLFSNSPAIMIRVTEKMQTMSGSDFGPAVVETFFAVAGDIEKMRETESDGLKE